MKHYLELISISSKIHKRQNRMAVLCITLAVFLVTAIFGMADMFVRSQILQSQQENGNWHISLRWISPEDAALIKARADVAAFSPYSVRNFRGGEGYTVQGKDAAVCGGSDDLATQLFPDMLKEGRYPLSGQEALVTENMKEALNLRLGDPILLLSPDGTRHLFTVSGFAGNTSHIMSGDLYGIFLTMDGLNALSSEAGASSSDDTVYFLRFAGTGNIQANITRLKSQFGLTDEQVSENLKLLGLLGQSADSFMIQVYAAAVILFVLVLTSGVLMIASSLNSSVAQRIQFFGLLRCIGATPIQVSRMVRREVFLWCRQAIPVGVFSGSGTVWILCAILRRLSPEYFEAMPRFGVSAPGILSGILTGLFTVLLAAYAPARRASQVSPLTAVSGNLTNRQPVSSAFRLGRLRIEFSLGLRHAWNSRKNFWLMAGSFSLTIILFLSFSVAVSFIRHTMTPLYPWRADISIVSPDNTCSISQGVLETLAANPSVDSAYGRMFAYEIPADVGGRPLKLDLVSYESRQFQWAGDYLLEGQVEPVLTDPDAVLMAFEAGSSLRAGNQVTLSVNGHTASLTIAGILSESPFRTSGSDGFLICSEETFRRLTGQEDYTVIDIQLKKDTKERDVTAIRNAFGHDYTIRDERLGNQSVLGVYHSAQLFLYGFLVLILLIAIVHTVNSIALSAAARTSQYGVLRAIGLSGRQLRNMLIAEAAAYVAAGGLIGTLLGLFFHRLLFSLLIYSHWGEA